MQTNPAVEQNKNIKMVWEFVEIYYVLERRFTKFSEITQYNGFYVVYGHSRSPILVQIVRS